jgi:DNA-binding NarL/FixJ family response regulator
MIRTLIVDDQDLVRDGIRAVLEAAPGIAVVGEAADGAEAVRLARSLRPEVGCSTFACRAWTGWRQLSNWSPWTTRLGSLC